MIIIITITIIIVIVIIAILILFVYDYVIVILMIVTFILVVFYELLNVLSRKHKIDFLITFNFFVECFPCQPLGRGVKATVLNGDNNHIALFAKSLNKRLVQYVFRVIIWKKVCLGKGELHVFPLGGPVACKK